MRRPIRRCVRYRIQIALTSSLLLPFEGCFDSDLAKRVRDAFIPVTDGLAAAVITPGVSEAGLRQAWAAFFEGLGNLLAVRDRD